MYRKLTKLLCRQLRGSCRNLLLPAKLSITVCAISYTQVASANTILPLNHKMVNKDVLIVSKVEKLIGGPQRKLITINGVVTNESNQPLPGVTVLVKGTKLATMTHRTDSNWDLYFLANTQEKPIKVDARFRSVQGSPELWNAVTGKHIQLNDFTTEGGVTTIPLQLDAYESCFIMFSTENKWLASKTKKETLIKTLVTLDGPWEVKFDPKWGGPASATFEALSDWTTNKDEGIKYYSGIAAYHKTFDFPQANLKQQIYLELGKVKNMARVTLNGKEVGVVWTAPWKIDISNHLLAKNNQLKIEVVNLWGNRLIGDEKKPDDGIKNNKWPDWLLNNTPRTSGRYTFTTSKQYNADSPLQESGLMGPVTINEETKKNKL